MKEKILLIGGGGHCRSVIDVIELEDKYTIAGIIDKKELIGQEILGYKVIGCDDDLEELFQKYKYAVITIGHIKSNLLRVKLFNILKGIGYDLPLIVSPLAYVSKHSTIDEGTVIMHQALINSNVKVGKNCIINSKALIEHDSIIEDNCHISTASVINGDVKVEEGTFFGSNATSKEAIVIEKSSFIKAGSLQK
ncbi:MAG: acetyltransferase [Sulfurimonas sp.]|nr:acetyltransferase [Sulfurimonas sp.]